MNETKVFRMKKNIVIIPARYKSIRFPGKPLAKISQKSMIQYIYDSIKNYSFLDEIIVATDDQRIVNHCIEMHIPYALTEENHQSGTDRVAEVAKNILPHTILSICKEMNPLLKNQILKN